MAPVPQHTQVGVEASDHLLDPGVVHLRRIVPLGVACRALPPTPPTPQRPRNGTRHTEFAKRFTKGLVGSRLTVSHFD